MTDWSKYDAYKALSELEEEQPEQVRISGGSHVEISGGPGTTKDKEELMVDDELKGAMDELMQKVQRNLRSAEGTKEEGTAALRKQCPEEALRLYEKALGYLDLCETARALFGPRITHRLNDLASKLHNNCASVLLQLNRPDDAILEAEASIAITPTAKAHFRVGQARERLEDWRGAHEAYREAQAISADVAISQALKRTEGEIFS